MQQSDNDLLDTPEASQVVRHSPRTLIRWRNEGIGPPYVKLGRKVLYRRDALRNWIQQREHTPVREVS